MYKREPATTPQIETSTVFTIGVGLREDFGAAFPLRKAALDGCLLSYSICENGFDEELDHEHEIPTRN